tara:strand:+ start:4959 stop:5246 length:288 start_codon:yes stop_codon:yes gene_type:complete
MNDRRRLQHEFDKIAGNRISKLNGGIKTHIALSNRASITFRNKIKRMGLTGEHIDDALKMLDDIGIQQTLQHQSLGVRFATVPYSKNKPKIYRPD